MAGGRAVVLVAMIAACSGKKEPAASGSGSGSVVRTASIADAALPVDAGRPATVLHNCWSEAPGVKCWLVSQGGTLPPKCWHVLVAIENHVAAKVRIVTTKQACSPEIKAGDKYQLALEVAAKDSIAKACEPDDACELELVAPDDLAATTAAWRKQVLDSLATEKAQREADARDAQIDHAVDLNKLLLHYAEITADASHDHNRDDAIRSVMSAGPMALMGVCTCPDGFTIGQVRCAFAASSPDSFGDCFKSNLPIDAGVQPIDAGDDASVPGD